MVGKACALFAILTSLSGRLSIVVGVEYMHPLSFAVCGVVAVGLLFLIRCMASHRARMLFCCLVLGFIVAWCAVVVYLAWFRADQGIQPYALLLFYAAVGRIVTLFINMQWNFHYSLNTIKQSPRTTVVAVLLAFCLFFLTTMVADFLAVGITLAAFIASGVLALVMERALGRNPRLPHSVESVEKADARAVTSSESYPRTRVLYFGARVLYGMAFGATVGLVSIYVPVGTAQLPVAALVVGAMALGVVGVWLFSSGGKGSLYLVVVTPFLVAFASYACFWAGDLMSVVSLSAMLVEAVWMTQNLFQLPSYRRMTGMKAATFSYYEYSAQIIPFYFVAWFASDLMGALGLSSEVIEPGIVGLACLVGLMGFSVSAMIWHIVRYYPRQANRREGGDGVVLGSEALENLPLMKLLTPRECEVFALLAEGYSRPYIAKTLYISVDTVKVHVKHIYAKLGVDSQDGLIELARTRS